MVRLYGAANSRYYLVRNGEKLALYRVPALLWETMVPGLIEVCHVSDRGDVFVRTRVGLFRLSVSKDRAPEPVHWEANMKGLRRGGCLGAVRFSIDGTDMAGEMVTSEFSLGGSIRRVFSGSKEPSATGHEVLLLGACVPTFRGFPKRLVDFGDYSKFHWAMSPQFLYMVQVCCGARGGSRFEVYRVHDGLRYSEFSMQVDSIEEVQVDDRGQVVMQIRSDPGELCIVIRDLKNVSYTVVLPGDAKLMHVWKQMICWKTRDAISISDFRGKVLCKASLEPLNSLGLRYQFFFNKHDEIDLVTLSGEELFLTRIDPDNLHIDAKRWAYVAQLKQESAVEQAQRARKVQAEAEERMREYQKLSRELENSLLAPKEELGEGDARLILPITRRGGVRNRENIIAELANTRARFFAGVLKRDTYLERLAQLNEELQNTPE